VRLLIMLRIFQIISDRLLGLFAFLPLIYLNSNLFSLWPHMISRFLSNKTDHPEVFRASFYHSPLKSLHKNRSNRAQDALKTNRMAVTHSSHARLYSQSRWKALACPTLITITFAEEAVPPPGRSGLCTAGGDGNLIPLVTAEI